MRFRRTAFVVALAGQMLVFFACSTGPSTGTSTSSTSSTGGTGGHGGAGGMEAGVCVHAEDYYDLCGGCELCLEEKCCPELTACRNTTWCIACVGNDPKAGGNCNAIDAADVLAVCALKCERCYPGLDAAPPDCYAPSPLTGGGGSGGGIP